jgi:hypothetical protein
MVAGVAGLLVAVLVAGRGVQGYGTGAPPSKVRTSLPPY